MAIPFPNIRPDIFTIPAAHIGRLTLGPFPIRWYAMAYIVGILLGWRYAVSLVKTPKLWGGAAPTATPVQFDDLVLWLTLGVIVGGRTGYILFYMLPLASARASLAADPLELFRVWHGGMSFHGGAIGVALAIVLFGRAQKIPLLGLGDIVAACAPIGLCSAASPTSSTANSGAGHPCALGHGVLLAAHRHLCRWNLCGRSAAAPSQPAL